MQVNTGCKFKRFKLSVASLNVAGFKAASLTFSGFQHVFLFGQVQEHLQDVVRVCLPADLEFLMSRHNTLIDSDIFRNKIDL